MVTREEALIFILSNEKRARRQLLAHIKERLDQQPFLPADIRQKFLSGTEEYGEFKLNQDWTKEIDSELWDAVCYSGLELLRQEFFKGMFP